MKMRLVRDTMGTLSVPADAYYGAQTARALENFPISGIRAHPELIRAVAAVKLASARVNSRLGLLDHSKAGAIEQAAREIFEGGLRDQIVVDVFNAGAGTSLHMNVNEVVGSRACELLGGDRGDMELIHPNDHVNLGQSTNDVMPTAIRLSGLVGVRRLESAAGVLASAFWEKAAEFDWIVKSGRTHLQDAVPLRLGSEFGAYASCLERWREALGEAAHSLAELGLGGSAVGTGLNTHPNFRRAAVTELSLLYGEELRPAADLYESMQSHRPVVQAMSAARGLALDTLRITNDLRLLCSGPRTGLAEIRLPAVQPGSSIMPGKVNPVMAEVTAMVCYHVIGCDAAVAAASSAGQLELNVMMPVIAFEFLSALETLPRALTLLADRCVRGIEADPARCRALAERSIGIATILNPILGYEQTAELVKGALDSGKSIREALEESGLLAPTQVDEVMDLVRWTEPGILADGGRHRPR